MSRDAGWICLVLALVSSSLSAACDDDAATLFVDLKTDFVPGVEFQRVRTTLLEGIGPGPMGSRFEEAASTATDYLEGSRIAEIEGLEPGNARVLVEVLEDDGTVVADRRIVVRFSGNRAVTVVVTRTCRARVCPDPGGDSQATECLGGRCVEPGCVEESADMCGPPDCASPADCPGGAACARVRCVAGACLLGADDSACGSGQRCDPELGCNDLTGDTGPMPDTSTPTDSGGDAGTGMLQGFQSGTATLTGASLDVAITAVDPSRSVLFFSLRGDVLDPRHGQVRGNLDGADNIRFNRTISGNDVTIAWYVAEFDARVSVQRGTAMIPDTSTEVVSLPSPVDPARSFALISSEVGGFGFDDNDHVRARLGSSSTLELSIRSLSFVNLPVVEWQVVEMADATVQSGDVDIAWNELEVVVDVAAYDPSRSFLLLTWQTGGSDSAIGTHFFRGRLLPPDQIAIDRGATVDSATASYFLVTLEDGSRVQTGDSRFDTTDTLVSATLAPVDRARSIAFVSGNQRGGISSLLGPPGTMTANPGVLWQSAELVADDRLELERGVTLGATTDSTWFVVELSGP